MKTYLCISLNDFHKNQKGAETNTRIKFINAKDQEDAIATCKSLYPNEAWFVVDKNYCDKRMVYSE